MSDQDESVDRSSNMISEEAGGKQRPPSQSTKSLGVEPEEINVANPLIREYLAERSPSLQDGSIKAYEVIFRHYVEYLTKKTEKGTGVLTATQDHIYSFFYHCAYDQGHSEKTVLDRKKALKTFYKYCQINKDPVISSVHVERALTDEIYQLCSDGFEREAISRDELDLLYANASSEMKRLIIQFTYETGGRNNDICDIMLDDVKLDKKWVTFRNSKHGKDYRVPIRDELVIRLRQWIHAGRKSFLDQRESSYLFPGPRTKRMRPTYHRKIVKNAAEAAGIQDIIYVGESPTGKREMKRVTPHTLRHSIITHLAEDQVDVKHRQHLAGHSNASTTEKIYTHDDETAGDILRKKIH